MKKFLMVGVCPIHVKPGVVIEPRFSDDEQTVIPTPFEADIAPELESFFQAIGAIVLAPEVPDLTPRRVPFAAKNPGPIPVKDED